MWMLPHWNLTDKHPAFYDTESGTATEQTAKVYGAMRELIGEYNKFADELNKALQSFELQTKEENECFKKCITELVENYIKSIDLKIDKQDLKLQEAVKSMTDNIATTTASILQNMRESGDLDQLIKDNILLVENRVSVIEATFITPEKLEQALPYWEYDSVTQELKLMNVAIKE